MSPETRTTRISCRCTYKELYRIQEYAKKLGVSFSDFMRYSILISMTTSPDRARWDRLVRAANALFRKEEP
jgi:hypothetical protein